MGAERRTVTVYSDEPHPELAEPLAEWNVELRFDRLPAGTAEGFVTIRKGSEFLGSVDARVLADFFEPTLTLPGMDRDEDGKLATFLDHLDETLFHATSRRQLLAATREFEDRAWRVGAGRLVAGFQRPAALEAQRSVYERIAARGLDVHVYFDGDWNTPTIPGVRMHSIRNDEIGQFWFVAFDDGSDASFSLEGDESRCSSQACALLAKETEPGTYSGFWTYDEGRVGSLLNYLTTTYR